MFFTNTATGEESEDLVRQFQQSRAEEYNFLLADTKALAKECRVASGTTEFTDLHVGYRRLMKHFQLIKARDYFSAPAGDEVYSELQRIQSFLHQSLKDQ